MSSVGRWVDFEGNWFQKSEYTDCIIQLGLKKAFILSGMTSPKRFLKERAHDQWKAWQVIKRMEGK